VIVKEALKLLRASLPKTIEIRQEIDPYAGPVLADSTQIHQVVVNLCTNAAHAMKGRPGIITIRLESVQTDSALCRKHPGLRCGRYVKFTVSDTGEGMKKWVKERIFDPFFTTKEEGKGTGMGMSLVHGIVASHEGAVSVESEPGEGTTIAVFLPQCREKLVEKTAAVQGRGNGSERILLVDDEEDIVRSMSFGLKRLGYQVRSTTSSREGLNIFRKTPNRFDLVITDLTMPEMTGEVLGEEIVRVRADIPIILTTGYRERISDKEAASTGIRECISKPFTALDLGRIVRQVLDKDLAIRVPLNE